MPVSTLTVMAARSGLIKARHVRQRLDDLLTGFLLDQLLERKTWAQTPALNSPLVIHKLMHGGVLAEVHFAAYAEVAVFAVSPLEHEGMVDHALVIRLGMFAKASGIDAVRKDEGLLELTVSGIFKSHDRCFGQTIAQVQIMHHVEVINVNEIESTRVKRDVL